MTNTVFSHEVKREVDAEEVRYRCVECDHLGTLVSDFERYGCPPER